MKQYFTEVEAAEAAGVSLETIREFITLGVLKLNPADAAYTQSYLTREELIGAFHSLKDLGVTLEIPKAEEPVHVPPAPPPIETKAHQIEGAVESAKVTDQVEIAPPPSLSSEHDLGSTLIEHRSFELLDLNKSLKEQIEILKQERDWLRQRVEKLEIRSERDQLLLMSETKNVQTLLPNHTGRKSFWSFLPWNQS